MVVILALSLAAALAASPAAPAPGPTTLVVCAPGYPGSTAEAQPSLDAFAAAAAAAAGWSSGSLAAVYHETEEAGVARLRDGAALALVPYPFFLKHRAALALEPILQAVPKGGEANETWSLVVKKGRITSPAQMSGWQIASLAGYAPSFIRDVALAGWGPLPDDVTFVATGQILSALRKVASGDNIAALLDGAQSASLATLPFAGDLEVVRRSPAIPSALLCSVGGRLPAARRRSLAGALQKLGDDPAGERALDGLRLSRFVPTNVGRVPKVPPR